ncbi:nicotinate phosphoribosyltransferase [Pseudomonas stutzeri]|uniref:Nicotinate phosphoribosyltransferase n=1 Tax=Stutzerimonas stutzeri TaxID=316 RepID=A0A2N8SL43_STUST|nr:nicotinate phosphoribosyltransferase [Stutzerimonas stutzeri]EQM78681.1 nicotinate phosphoribosyltransferase [Stutzerimonas stutzeri MF28]MCI0918229.1 nicotinate phosphoribosyltransferase [Stutzerimonas stutzeri]MCQ4251445.1 nicotinate phosphoribosyltransferase [Stutzerimonas stutzeri]PNG03195.1 nicotinate phosphoribosyltransferase [Stutzerimonas stutzeri]
MGVSAFTNRIIQSLMDTDYYKLTMMQAVLHHYPNAEVEWAFRSRSEEDLSPYLDAIREQMEALAELRFEPAELAFLENIPYMQPDFIRFLGLFRFDPRYVRVELEAGELVVYLRGPWLHVILFEVPLLAIISEVRNRVRYPHVTLEQAEARLDEKLEWLRTEASEQELAGFNLADFGTRRRFSFAVQARVVERLKTSFPGNFVGTSNLHLAHKLKLKPMGTMAHEWIMAHQQLGPRLIDSQSAALDCWAREYRGALGIAITDCITMDAFTADFDLYLAKLFDGLRHDSGDPIEWAEKAIAHYRRLGIDPMTRQLVFSDGLDFPKALGIYRALAGRSNTSYGIGTQLTCDIPGVEPTNMVIKMTSCNGQPVAKISDSPGKTMCRDEAFVAYLKHVFSVTH